MCFKCYIIINFGYSLLISLFFDTEADGHPCSWLMVGDYVPHNGLPPSGLSPCMAHKKKAVSFETAPYI
jgi:hypothetical protein